MLAQLCFVAVSTQRENMEVGEYQNWEELEQDIKNEVTGYVLKVLTGQQCPDTPDGRMIARLCHQFVDEKKSLKYA